MERQRMLPLLGTRALEAVEAPDSFRRRVEDAVTASRHRAALVEAGTLRIAARLEAASIPALPLKGPLLARQVHGDTGSRPSDDVDLLVPQARLWEAADILAREEGYTAPRDRLDAA